MSHVTCHMSHVTINAQMAELVDALVSGTSIRKNVQVRVLFWAPQNLRVHFFFLYLWITIIKIV